MSENYPAGVTISTETINSECSCCEHSWSATVTIELGIITQDDYNICTECGKCANSQEN